VLRGVRGVCGVCGGTPVDGNAGDEGVELLQDEVLELESGPP
jgi:hypothetical protein